MRCGNTGRSGDMLHFIFLLAMNRFLWILGFVFSLLSCNSSTNNLPPAPGVGDEGTETVLGDSDSSPNELSLASYAPEDDGKYTISANDESMPRKLVRNASLEIQVQSVESFLKTFEKEITRFGAYSVSTNMNRHMGEINESIELKVPPKNLDSLITFLKDKSVFIRNFSTSTDDVTASYYDSQARLKTKKELEARYFEILKSAKKVSEILEVEEKLSEVRAEIESFEGQLKLYDHQVAYSSLSLQLYELIPSRQEPTIGFGSRLIFGFETGWHKMLASFISVIENWFWILAGVIGWVTVRRYRLRKRA